MKRNELIKAHAPASIERKDVVQQITIEISKILYIKSDSTCDKILKGFLQIESHQVLIWFNGGDIGDIISQLITHQNESSIQFQILDQNDNIPILMIQSSKLTDRSLSLLLRDIQSNLLFETFESIKNNTFFLKFSKLFEAEKVFSNGTISQINENVQCQLLEVNHLVVMSGHIHGNVTFLDLKNKISQHEKCSVMKFCQRKLNKQFPNETPYLLSMQSIVNEQDGFYFKKKSFYIIVATKAHARIEGLRFYFATIKKALPIVKKNDSIDCVVLHSEDETDAFCQSTINLYCKQITPWKELLSSNQIGSNIVSASFQTRASSNKSQPFLSSFFNVLDDSVSSISNELDFLSPANADSLDFNELFQQVQEDRYPTINHSNDNTSSKFQFSNAI